MRVLAAVLALSATLVAGGHDGGANAPGKLPPQTRNVLVERDLSVLKLRATVHVTTDTVTLADVLDFAQADPRLSAEIGVQPVASDLHPPGAVEITHERVVGRLGELGVNLARVLVQGALVCRVTLEAPPATPSPTQAGPVLDLEAEAPLLRAPTNGLSDGVQTLAAVLRAFIDGELRSLAGSAEVEFERAGQEFLALTTPPWDFSIRSEGGRPLGLREYNVVLRRDGRTERTVRVVARVRLTRPVLIARRALSVGAFIKPEDVAVESRLFEQGEELGLERENEVIGQQLKRFVPAGELLRRGDLKEVDLVKRARPVTVVGAGGNVHIRLTGIALDNGGYGDTVRVRLGESRRDRRELRGVVTGVGTVSIVEGQS